MIKAVVFDADGTLLNSFELIVGAYQHVAGLYGRPAPTAEQVRDQLAQARPLRDIYRTFFPGGDIDAMLVANGEYLAANATSSSAYQGLHEMLDSLQGQGLRMGILTGGNHRIHDMLAHHDIATYFGSVVHQDRVARSKPDPEGFLLVTDELGVFPAETVMVGDSPADIFAGKNGGAYATIGLTHGNATRETLEAADADYLVDSLVACTAAIQRLLGKQ